MFKLLRILVLAFAALIIIGAIIYFLPLTAKEKVLTFMTGIVPASLKDQAAELILTPPEQRAKIIQGLEDRISRLKNNSSVQTSSKIIEESEQLITELKEKNNDASLTSIIMSKLVEKLIGDGADNQSNRCIQ